METLKLWLELFYLFCFAQAEGLKLQINYELAFCILNCF